MNVDDFLRLPTADRFEELVCHLLEALGLKILERPATGPDGGRDIIVERILEDLLGERRQRMVVQCKHFAQSGKAVGVGDIRDWTSALHRHNSEIYLLATSTRATESVNDLAIASDTQARQQHFTFIIWDGARIAQLVNDHPEVENLFFSSRPTSEEDIWPQGWAAIFPQQCDTRIIDALAELLKLRKRQTEQAGGLFRIYSGNDGYISGEEPHTFLSRIGITPGSPDLSKLPFFLLIVGSASEIPFSFQSYLGVQRAIGRIHFDSIDDYASYAKRIVQAEAKPTRSTRATFISVDQDPLTHLAYEELTQPLYDYFTREDPEREAELLTGENASKEKILRAINGKSSFVFIMAHGLFFPQGHELRAQRTGSIVTADWPGRGTSPQRDHFISAEDIDETRSEGKIILLLCACSAGLGHKNEYSSNDEQWEPFVAALPKALLSRGAEGTLALIGHIGGIWWHSFHWPDAQPHTFREVIKKILAGKPIGIAHQELGRRYSELSVRRIEAINNSWDESSSEDLRIALIDARDYVVIGDPAVRLNNNRF